MSLTHVCVWDGKNGYRRVSIEEACQIYPHGIPASCGFFVCSICAENVLLTAPGKNIRHFRHTLAKKTKECEDRAQVYARAPIGYNCHPMPIRIRVQDDSYRLELGFFHSHANEPKCRKVIIKTEDGRRYEYSSERLSTEGITYLNVGDSPSSMYHMDYKEPSRLLERYWPTEAPGIDCEGAIFEYASGKVLHAGSKAYPNRDYFLLQKGTCQSEQGICCEKIAETANTIFPWRLYKIHIYEFSESVAKFFLKRHIFLTEKPVHFYPVWPSYVEDPYFLYHSDPDVYFYMQGNDTELNVYPRLHFTQCMDLDGGKLYKLHLADREQLVSLGYSGAMGFSYLMMKPLDMTAKFPVVQVQCFDGKILEQDVFNQLPKEKQVIIQAPFHGVIRILREGNVLEIRRIEAGQAAIVDGLAFGHEIEIFQGCDLVRTIRFEKLQEDQNYADIDRKLVNRLRNCKGTMIPISHEIGAISKYLNHFPLTKKWVYLEIRKGQIVSTAYLTLIKTISQMEAGIVHE